MLKELQDPNDTVTLLGLTSKESIELSAQIQQKLLSAMQQEWTQELRNPFNKIVEIANELDDLDIDWTVKILIAGQEIEISFTTGNGANEILSNIISEIKEKTPEYNAEIIDIIPTVGLHKTPELDTLIDQLNEDREAA